MEYRNAVLADVDGVLGLQKRYHVSTIREEDRKDGFVTTEFTAAQLADLIGQEDGLAVACEAGEIVAYVMAASWSYWSAWPLFRQMISELPLVDFHGHPLDTSNSYQYGPVCIDKAWRGRGVLEEIFAFSLGRMSRRYRYLVTFINRINTRSYAAHVGKLGLEVLRTFEFNGNGYYELACETGPELRGRPA